jgi:hypothetical protein
MVSTRFDIERLPCFVKLLVHVVMMLAAALALPSVLGLRVCDATLTASSFAQPTDVEPVAAVRRKFWRHAFLWPLRVVAAVLAPLMALGPCVACGWAVWLATRDESGEDGSVPAAMCAAVAALCVELLGGYWVLHQHGIFGYLPPCRTPRPLAMLRGAADSMLDCFAALCLLLIVGTGLRLPALLGVLYRRMKGPSTRASSLYKGRGLRRELTVQAKPPIAPLVCIVVFTLNSDTLGHARRLRLWVWIYSVYRFSV